MFCAITHNYYSADTESGWNLITNSVIEVNDDEGVVWYRSGGSFGDCNVEAIYLHEIGHHLGFGHNDNTSSVMHSPPVESAALQDADRDHVRAVYGYSSSSYRKGFKVSSLVDVRPGLSSGLVTVASVGKTKGDRHGLPVTPLRVVGQTWKGALPGTLWQVAGELTHPRHGAITAGPALQPGRQYVVTVRDSDSQVLSALPVEGGAVQLPEDFGWIGADDVDGGDQRKVAVGKLQAKTR